MPTKERLKREKERDKLKGVLSPSKKLLEMIPFERLGRIAPCVGVDSNGDLYLQPKTGVGGNNSRHDKKQEYVLELKAHPKYRAIWGKRGGAKIIAIDEEISVRTVQKYFKDFP